MQGITLTWRGRRCFKCFVFLLSYWEDSEGGEVPPDDHVTTVPFFFTKSWGFHREVFRCWERTANRVLIASSYFTLYSVKLSYGHIFHDTQRPPSNTSCRKTQTPNAPTSPETTFRSKPDQFDLHLKLVLLKTWKKKNQNNVNKVTCQCNFYRSALTAAILSFWLRPPTSWRRRALHLQTCSQCCEVNNVKPLKRVKCFWIQCRTRS